MRYENLVDDIIERFEPAKRLCQSIRGYCFGSHLR
jgi:hypothetical protein